MGVKIADKLEQFNNGTYYLVDSSAVEYVDKDGNTKSVKEALDGTSTDTNTHKTVIFENNIDMGKYLLLAKITGANYSNNIIKFSCPNYKGVNDAGFKYEDDMDIYKFELHFNTGASRETNNYGVTLKQHGLGLYSYPLSNPKNTEPSLEEAIRLYWDYSKGDIYVFLVDMMTAIPHCVLEYTGSGTLLRENTFVNDDLYNRRDGLNGTWEDSKWKSIPFNKLEIPPIHELGGGSTEGVKTYTSLGALGLTADATVEDVVNALKKGESFLAPVNTFTNYETIFPNELPNDKWNKIHIIKGISFSNSHIRCFSQSGTCEYLANINNTNVVSWNDVSGTYIDISDSIIEKLGSEILKYPVGKYRINSSATGNKFTDLPSDAETKCGLIEVSGTSVGKSPFTDTWVYRMYKFECLIGTSSYIRRLNSGNTVGQIEVDTGWRKEAQQIYNYLSELGLTAPVTVGEIFNAMPTKTMLVLACEAKEGNTDGADVHVSDVPISHGVLTIKKNELGRFSIEYQNSLQGSVCNVRRWIGTLKGSDGTGLTWKLVSTEPTYVTLSDIGLSARATLQDAIDALPKGGSAILGVKEFTNYQTIFPYEEGSDQFARVHIVKGVADGSCVYARWFRKDGGKEAIAIFNTNDNKFNGWQKIITENSKTNPYSCTGYTPLTGTEDLFTLPCGHYVSEKADTAYNYPVTDSYKLNAHIYVLGHLNDPTNNKGYRIILYFDNKNRMYRINEWWGVFTDNGWQNMQLIGNGGSSTNYSTSEQAIGTWVDGKTIYRKTITKGSHGANEQLITGVDTFIRGYGTCERAGYVYNVPHCGLLAGHLQDEDVPYLNFKLDTNGALSTIGSSTYTISKLKVTLEYTKK